MAKGIEYPEMKDGIIHVKTDPDNEFKIIRVEHRPKRLPRKLKKALRTECPRRYNKAEAWLETWGARVQAWWREVDRRRDASRKTWEETLSAEFPGKTRMGIHMLVCQFNDIQKAREYLQNNPEFQ